MPHKTPQFIDLHTDDYVTNMGLVFYPKPKLDIYIVLHKNAGDTHSYFNGWRAQAAGINSQCILKVTIPVLTVIKTRDIEKNLHR